MEGSLDDLQALTQAVQRWDGRGLSGHGDIIFRAPDDIVSEIAENHLQQYGIDITENLHDLKELEVGKKNFVILYSKANPKAGLETSIKHVKEILDKMKKELLEQALMDGFNDLPKTCNHFHVSILRVFYMFFNSSNLFDSATELLPDINRAIHVPIPIK